MPTVIDEEFLRQLYTKETFSEILETLKARLREKFPQWSDHLPSDFGVVLLELFAGIADLFRFYQNVTAVEAFPATARLRESLFRHAKWLGYLPKPAGAARTTLKFTVQNPALGAIIPMGTQVSTEDGSVVFETTETLEILPGKVEGTVGAVHGHFVRDELLGVSTGDVNQRFALRNKPLVVLSTGSDPSELPYVRVWVDGEEWTQVRSLAWAAELGGANDKVFKIEIEPDDVAYVVFGDGLFGRIPPEGAQIVATYIVGGGPEGNVGKGTLTKLVGNVANIASVTNIEPATGGYPAESEEELRKNIPSQVITRGRAVTRDDYKRLLEAFGEVAKVNIHHPRDNIVEVYVLPQGGGLPSDELKQKLAQYLDNIRMITEDVRILDPTLVPINIELKVWVQKGVSTKNVASQVYQVLKEEIGKPEFARRLYPSDIYRIVQGVPGVLKVDVDALYRADEAPDVEAIVCGPDEIITEGTIKVIALVYPED